MRLNTLSTLGAVLGLGTSGAFAGVICDPKHSVGDSNPSTILPSAEILANVANTCIEDVCASAERIESATKDCGSVLLTITHLSTPVPDDQQCLKGFREILEHCIVNEGTRGGIFQTSNVVYDIAVAGVHQSQSTGEIGIRSDEHVSEDDEESKDIIQNPPYGVSRRKGRRADPKKSNVAPKATTPKQPIASPKVSTPKKPEVPKDQTKKPDVTKDTANSCALPTKGTGEDKGGKKSVRDVVEGLLPESLSGVLFPRGNAPSSIACTTEWYQYTQLSQKAQVDWWSFKTLTSKWNNAHPATSNVGKVLNAMKANGKLDVIKLKGAKMDVVGNPGLAVPPNKIPVGKGKYLLTNGGFFRYTTDLARSPSIGPTSLAPRNFLPIPQKYERYYEKLQEGDQFLWTGPSLKATVPVDLEEFTWRPENFKIPGSLAHAKNPNERLAIAIVGSDKYIFAYTGKSRKDGDGVTLNQLRDIIDTFLKVYARSSVAAAGTVLNLDGGGSLYVSWWKRGKETLIARGDTGATNRGGKLRAVANYLQLNVA